MATTTRDTPIARPHEVRPDEGSHGDDQWGGPKLIALGAVALLCALIFLYTVSPYSGVLFP